MAYSQEFSNILDRLNSNDLNPVIFDLTSVDSNVFSLMGHWQKAARKAGWQKVDTDIVLKECTSGDYDHAVVTILEVSCSEEPEEEEEYDDDEDEDDRRYGLGLHDDEDDYHIRKRF
jgi:hypothetical protein